VCVCVCVCVYISLHVSVVPVLSSEANVILAILSQF